MRSTRANFASAAVEMTELNAPTVSVRIILYVDSFGMRAAQVHPGTKRNRLSRNAYVCAFRQWLVFNCILGRLRRDYYWEEIESWTSVVKSVSLSVRWGVIWILYRVYIR